MFTFDDLKVTSCDDRMTDRMTTKVFSSCPRIKCGETNYTVQYNWIYKSLPVVMRICISPWALPSVSKFSATSKSLHRIYKTINWQGINTGDWKFFRKFASINKYVDTPIKPQLKMKNFVKNSSKILQDFVRCSMTLQDFIT